MTARNDECGGTLHRVLFIGNSYTARHDLPALIAHQIGNMRAQMVVAGGASLRRHWNSGRASSAIESDAWTHVVLQEQSTLPIKNRARFHENVRLFDRAIRDVGAKPVLYLTWARASAPESQSVLNAAVREIAAELGATIAPVGVAWACARSRYPDIALHLADGSHPTGAGAFLSACVFSATLAGPDRALLTRPPSLQVGDRCARALADIALETVEG
ncbi:MAG: SGNH/GDSL hydrolase family protein [Pseudomonadota bacterium]|nr:SGNH/GDSL hydrolase family protein [Pseudomonadota bacterium]